MWLSSGGVFQGAGLLPDRVRGRPSARSEMAPVVTVFFMREPAAAALSTGLVSASSLLARFSWEKSTHLPLAPQTSVSRDFTSFGNKLFMMLRNMTVTDSAEALVRGQRAGGSGCFHGWGDGAGGGVAQGALPGPLLETRLGQPHLGGARFHHGCASRTKPGIWQILQQED